MLDLLFDKTEHNSYFGKLAFGSKEKFKKTNNCMLYLLILKGVTSCFCVRRPTTIEFEDEDIPKLDMTYESPEWDPSDAPGPWAYGSRTLLRKMASLTLRSWKAIEVL